MHRSPAPASTRATGATAVALLALLLALLLVGCSAGSSESASSTADSAGESGGGAVDGGGGAGSAGAGGGGAGSAGAGGAGAGGGGGSGRSAPPPGDVTSLASGRVAAGAVLIRTAELSVEVDDVGGAADEAARVAAAADGTVAAEERSADGDDGTDGGSAVVVLRVPPGELDSVVRRLADLGEEVDRRVSTQDVTDQVVDLDARLATQRASVARVRALLDEADELGDVVQIEGELTRRTADLESLQARLAALEEQVDLSTVTVRLYGEDGLGSGTGPGGFTDGLAAGWSALIAVVRAAGLTVGALLPFSPLLLLAGALVWRSRARRAAA